MTRSFVLALALAPAVTPAFATAGPATTPVQWSGNCHYYQLVSPPAGITWTSARDAAFAATFQGLPGHLVTFGSDEEWQFVRTTFPTNFTWIGLTDQVV